MQINSLYGGKQKKREGGDTSAKMSKHQMQPHKWWRGHSCHLHLLYIDHCLNAFTLFPVIKVKEFPTVTTEITSIPILSKEKLCAGTSTETHEHEHYFIANNVRTTQRSYKEMWDNLSPSWNVISGELCTFLVWNQVRKVFMANHF